MIELNEYDCISIDGKTYSMNGIDLIKEYSECLSFNDIENPRRSCVGIQCSLKDLAEVLRAGGKTNYIHVKNVIINCEKVKELYIQTAKDEHTNKLGYALHVILRGEGKFAYRHEEIFCESHLEAERYYHAIDSIIEDIKNKEVINSLINS